MTSQMAPGRASFEALGSRAIVAVAEAGLLPAARAAAVATIDAYDLACSRFREDSELTALNRAAGRPQRVSPLLFGAVAAALRAGLVTDGLLDPTVGAAILALGYDADFPTLTARRPPRARLIPAPGYSTVEVDRDRLTVRLTGGVRLDLGATAKAQAADDAAAAARKATGTGVLVALGGDIALAGPPPLGGWRIRVTDDHRSGVEAPGQWIDLHTGGLATSSVTVRRWATTRGPMHHLIDPATGAPARTQWRTASVAAATCVDANIGATAAILQGESAPAWLASRGLPARLVDAEGVARQVSGWPSERDDLACGVAA